MLARVTLLQGPRERSSIERARSPDAFDEQAPEEPQNGTSDGIFQQRRSKEDSR